MVICICNNKTEEDIQKVKDIYSCRTIQELQEYMPICTTCKSCEEHVKEILDDVEAR